MSLTNYVDETYLKGLIPELSKLLWTSETDFSKQKQMAEHIVRNDFINKGFKAAFLSIPLWLKENATISATETTTAVEDKLTRLRYRYNITTYTGTAKTIVIKGCNTETGTYTTLVTLTISAVTTAETGGYISTPYKYYELVTTLSDGTLGYDVKLVETNYDLFFAYKWLELILMDSFKEEGDQFYLKMLYFKDLYNKLWNDTTIFEDLNEDDSLDTDEGFSDTNIYFSR